MSLSLFLAKILKKVHLLDFCLTHGIWADIYNQAFSTTVRGIYREIYGIDYGIGTYGLSHSLQYGSIRADTKIGSYCSLAPGVFLSNANHNMTTASTGALFTSPLFRYQKEETIARVPKVIGNDVWIGQNAMILMNCTTIGNGACIGAGSVVTKDVPPYAIVAGNPARILRMRFKPDVIEKLEESKWWELKPDILFAFKEYHDNPKLFAERIIEYRRNTEI